MVFEHDDVDAAALIFCGIGLETAVVASVVDFFLATWSHIDKPTVTVIGVVTVLIATPLAASDKIVKCVGLALRRFLHEDVTAQCILPLEEIVGGGVDAAVGLGGKECFLAIVALTSASSFTM